MALQVGFLVSGLFDSNGQPLSSGTVDFFSVGTVVAKTIWEDFDKVTPASNPITLDARGTLEIYADGFYDVVIKDSTGATIHTQEKMFFDQSEATTATIADGAVTFAKLSSGVQALLGQGQKNLITNGGMDLWPNGSPISVGPSDADDLPTAFNWRYEKDPDSGTDIDADVTQNSVIGGTGYTGSPRYSLKTTNIDIGSSLGNSSYHRHSTRISGVEARNGQETTISLAGVSSVSMTFYVYIRQYFGSGGSPSSDVYTAGGRISTTTVNGQKSVTLTIPSISGKTIGSNNDDYLEINVSAQHGSSRGSTIQDSSGALSAITGSYEITEAQLEIGDSASSFETRPEIIDAISVDKDGGVRYQGAFQFGSTSNEVTLKSSKEGEITGVTTTPPDILSGSVDAIAILSSGQIKSSKDSTSSSTHYSFYNPNGQVGSIQTNGSSTLFNTSSDPRLKSEFTQPTTEELEAALAGLAACSGEFHFLADDSNKKVWGFNAHAVEDLEFGSEIATSGDGPRGLAIGDEYDSGGGVMRKVTSASVDQSKPLPGLVMICNMMLKRIKALESK